MGVSFREGGGGEGVRVDCVLRPRTHPPLRRCQECRGSPQVAVQLRQVQRGAVADLRDANREVVYSRSDNLRS